MKHVGGETAPQAQQFPHVLETHGHEREDPWYWLRDDRRANRGVLEHLKAENAYAERVLSPTRAQQELLFDEIKGRIVKDDSTVPYELNGYWYYSRFEEGKEYAVHCRRRETLASTERVILNENVEAEPHDFYQMADLTVSPNAELLAYSEDTLSRRIYTLRFRSIDTGENYPEAVEGTAGPVVWAADSRTVFYVKRDLDALRAYQVWRHRLGTHPVADVLVYEEKDDTFYVSIQQSKSREYVLIHSESTLVTEARFLATDNPEGEFKVFYPREAEHEYSIDHGADSFFVRTNWLAKNFRLMKAPEDKTTERESWTEVVSGRSDVFLHDFELFRKHLVLNERSGGLRGLRVIPWSNPWDDWSLDFGEPTYTAVFSINPSFESTVLRYSYTSLTTPSSIYEVDMVSRMKTLKKREQILGGFDGENYVSERLEAVARDGTRVPISLVYRKDLDRTRPQPLYEYGYGSYGYSMDPHFSAARLSLLDRGFIYAIAHIRGGQEFGRAWYEDGKLLKKRNTFTDFIDCGHYLIEQGYTSSDLLVASGGSAGGLLVGAVANMAPEQYGAIIAHVPFVDVVTTMLDETIPLTTFEYDEWGNPNQEKYYEYMLSYSPYDQVKEQDYPHIFVFTGLHDSQVQYWEPAKWVAKLRERKTDQNLLLFLTNMEAGHGGASGRFRKYRETAMEYAFLLDVITGEPASEPTSESTGEPTAEP